MNGFDVTVADYPGKELVGIKVRTTMAKAKEDCSALWQSFCPIMQNLAKSQGYGISIMLSAQDFEYWTAVEAPKGATPAGVEAVSIPAGAYARCTVPNLESIGAGYMFLYQTWVGAQQEWTINEQGPCFELYAADWTPGMPIDLFMPVKR